MSDFDYDDDDQYGSDQNGTDLVKQLRKQLREASRERDELRTQNEVLTKSTRTATLTDILRSKNVNPKLAAFISKDEVEPTEEAVTKWLADYGDVFNVSPTADHAGDAAEAARTQDATAPSPVPVGDDAALLAFKNALAAVDRAQVGSSPTATPAAAAESALMAAAGNAKSANEFLASLRTGQV